MNLQIAARSLLKTTSNLVPSCSATDSGPVEGKLGIVEVGDSGSGGSVEMGDLAGMVANKLRYGGALGQPVHTNPLAVEHVRNTSHSGSDLH